MHLQVVKDVAVEHAHEDFDDERRHRDSKQDNVNKEDPFEVIHGEPRRNIVVDIIVVVVIVLVDVIVVVTLLGAYLITKLLTSVFWKKKKSVNIYFVSIMLADIFQRKQ